MIIEYIVKIIFSISLFIVIIYSLCSIHWLWTHQIDAKESFYSFFKTKTNKNVGWLKIIDPNYIYQNGKYVGKTTTDPEKINGNIIFKEILDAEELNPEELIEFRRMKLKIIDGKGKGKTNYFGVKPDNDRWFFMKNVVCEKVK